MLFFFPGYFLFFCCLLDSQQPGMEPRYFCTICLQRPAPPFFLKDASSLPSSRVFATCYPCRERRSIQSKKRRPALQEIDPNIGPPSAQRRATSTSRAPFRPSTINQSPIPPVNPLLRPPLPVQPPDIGPPSARRRATSTSWAPFSLSVINQGPIPPVQPPVSPVQPPQPPPDTFIPTDQWRTITEFHTHMSTIKMEECSQCNARWFDMQLKDGICHSCLLKDKGRQTLYFFSADNDMDPGIVPAHLPALSQIEEMVIAQSHVQMMIKRYRGHQYQYTGHCVSFA
jgi:hypothetical protein